MRKLLESSELKNYEREMPSIHSVNSSEAFRKN